MNTFRFFALAVACAGLFATHEATAEDPSFGAPTVYGRFNVTAEAARNGDGDAADNGLVDNGSRLGLRAGESIGEGRSVMMQFESRLRQPGESGWWAKTRDTWVGMSDETLGTVRLGKMEGPLYHALYDEISMHNHDSGRSADKLLAEDATGGRMTKSIYYRAPLKGDVKVELLHAFLDKNADRPHASNPRHDEFAITYNIDDSWIAGGYAESSDLKLDKAWTIGASTTAKGFVLAGLMERWEAVPVSGATASRNYARVAVKYPVDRHEFHFNYGKASSLSTMHDSGATQSTLAYNYNITKLTKLYAFATRIRNEANASYSFLRGTTDGAANTSMALGVRRNF